jgi:hypothetical protein
MAERGRAGITGRRAGPTQTGRVQSRGPNRSNGPQSRGPSPFIHGDEARQRSDVEREEARRRREEGPKDRQPFRFWMPPDTERDFIILDDAPDVFLYEHNLMNNQTQRRDLFIPCVKDHAECPLCRIKGSTYVLLLSVIDLAEFQTRNGDWHDFSRKLLAVKPSQQKRFIRHFQKEGSLRGARFTAIRDSGTDAAIGGQHEFVEYVPEEELATYISSYQTQDGTVVEEDCSVPFEYEKIIRVYSTEEMERLAGLEPLPGSSRSNARYVDRGYDRDGRNAGGRSAPRPASRRREAPPVDDWDEDGPQAGQDYDDQGYDDTPPRRPAARRGAAPASAGRETRSAARAPARREAAPAAPSRRPAPSAPARPAPRTVRAPAPSAAEDFDDDIPF